MNFLPMEKQGSKDILQLARHYIRESAEQLHTGPKELSREAEEYLLSRRWPEDGKELEVLIKRACILSDGPVLSVEDLDLEHRQIKSIGRFIESRLRGFMKNIKALEKFNLYDIVLSEVEKALIVMVMKETGGNQIKAAKLLGINRNTLRSKIKKLGIKRDRW
jgi:DNA-binding NtrC family response regulator